MTPNLKKTNTAAACLALRHLGFRDEHFEKSFEDACKVPFQRWILRDVYVWQMTKSLWDAGPTALEDALHFFELGFGRGSNTPTIHYLSCGNFLSVENCCKEIKIAIEEKSKIQVAIPSKDILSADATRRIGIGDRQTGKTTALIKAAIDYCTNPDSSVDRPAVLSAPNPKVFWKALAEQVRKTKVAPMINHAEGLVSFGENRPYLLFVKANGSRRTSRLLQGRQPGFIGIDEYQEISWTGIFEILSEVG